MRPFGRGILPDSHVYFYDNEETDRQIFLYVLCAGHYRCSGEYIVNRQSYDSFLMLYVASGEAWYMREGRRIALPEHSFALIDCYRPHIYGSDTGCELYWVHFDGAQARPMYDRIHLRPQTTPAHFDQARRSIVALSSRSEANGQLLKAPEAHRLLTNLLTEFILTDQPTVSAGQDVIDEVRTYILENAEQDLSLDSLAERARMSPFHFTRQFKRYVGTTPHLFLVNARINTAKFYLTTSDLTVKEIAFNCGFSSVSTFCTCFKKHVGATPMDYRSAQLTGKNP